MQNAERYIDPIIWATSEVTTANEYGEAYGCLDLVPFSDVHYYATENHDEVIVYQPDPDAFSTPWGCDIYDSEGCTIVAGAQGQTMEEAFENAIVEFCVINARETEKDSEDVINVATAQAFAALNDGMYPDDSDPREVWEALAAIRNKVMQLEPMPEPEPEPEQDEPTEPEHSEKAAEDAREYASMCAFIAMSCALASVRAALDGDEHAASHAARAAQNNADRAADAARHANESAPDSMTARSAREYAAHAQTGADIAARAIHDLTRPSAEDLAAKYDNAYLVWSE